MTISEINDLDIFNVCQWKTIVYKVHNELSINKAYKINLMLNKNFHPNSILEEKTNRSDKNQKSEVHFWFNVFKGAYRKL